MAVCSIDYIGKTYSEKDAPHIAALHEQVEHTLKTLGKDVLQKGFRDSKNFRPKNYRTETYNKIVQVVNRVNAIYDGKVVLIKKDVNARNYLTVNVNPIGDRSLYHINSSIDLLNQNTFTEKDGEIVNKSDFDYERRVTNLDLDGGSLDYLVNQIQTMETKFKQAGVSVSVVLDGDLKASGAVLSKTHPTRIGMIQDGTLSEDGFLIAINPNLLASDTILHEFGHIFIDLIGGVKNPRIQAAYQKLKGSPVYNQVVQLYPELTVDSDTFIKEVVNTALGKQASDIFSIQDQKNWWNRFVDWFNESVGRIFNLNKDHIKDLSKDFLNVQTQTFKKDISVNTETYFHKKDPTVKATVKKISNLINSITDANKVIKADIDKLISDYERRTAQKLNASFASSSKASSEEKKLFALKEISKKYDKIKVGEEQKFLLNFTQEISNTAENFKEHLDGYIDKLNAGKPYNVNSRIQLLSVVKQYSNLFYIAEDILSDINNMGLTPENKKLIEEALTQAVSKRDGIMRNYKDLGIDVIVETQAGNYDIIRTEYKNRFEIEYNQTKDDQITDVILGETKDAFVNRKLTDVHDQILQETKSYLRGQLRESIDIGSVERFLRDEKSINSSSITVLSRIFDEADLKRNRAFIPYRVKAQPIFDAYNDQHGQANQKQMYDQLLDQTENSTYLLGEYKAEFYETVLKYSKEILEKEQKIQDEVDKDKKKLLQKELRGLKKERTKWFKNNTEEYEVSPTEKSRIPKAKWKNSKYAQIKANPDSVEAKMLTLLEELNDKAETNTKGLKTLNRSIDGIETVFRRLPAIGRDSLEKLSGGDYKENAKDIFERLFKYKEDDQAIGNIEGEDAEIEIAKNAFKNLAIVKGNFAGDERHLIPIYFRHQFDNKTNSYDLMTIYMMNLFMSENFNQKSDIQPIVELLVNVNDSKRTIEAKDLEHLAKAYFISKDEVRGIVEKETSNEQLKLQSMTENRLYGIKTVEQEYGKIAETVLAWTGSTMLALNFYSGMANIVQGKIMNFIEAAGGEFFNLKELTQGESKFFADMDKWVQDMGSLNPSSKTRRLLDLLDPQGDFKGISERYIRSNRFKALASRSSLSFPNSMGEMYIQSTLMYTVLSKIKAYDKDGNYLGKGLKPVKTEAEALSLDEIIQINPDGTYSLPAEVYNTTFSTNSNGDHDKILLETKNLIKKITSDLHGQYDDEIQSHAQRTMVGKALFMLRKWVVPGVDRRFRGAVHAVKGKDWMDFDQIDNEDFRQKRFYSQDTKSFREGTYTTMIRFTRQLIKEGDLAKIFIASKTGAWNKMTDHEKANVKKFAVEFATIILSLISAWILKGLSEELPEDEAQAVFLAAYAFRRLHQELAAYVNPLEALQLMRSPAASISLLENSVQLLGRTVFDGTNVLLGNDAEVYQTGKRKGELKIAKEFKDVFPVLSQTNRNLEDVMEYTFKMY